LAKRSRTKAKSVSRVAAAGPRILIAEDNEDIGQTLQMLLESLGYEVELCPDGEAAVRASLTFRPDIVILDIGMPRLSGYDAAHLIRKSHARRTLLIVAISGWARSEDVALSKSAGIDVHLSKPLAFDALVAVLDDFRKRLPAGG